MNIEVKTYANTLCEVIVESENTKIREDIAILDMQTKKYEADSNILEELITASFDISRFNGVNDVDFVKEIFENFLNTQEQNEFLENIQK